MRKAIHEEGRKGRNFNYSSGRHRNGWCEMMEILVAVEAQGISKERKGGSPWCARWMVHDSLHNFGKSSKMKRTK